MRTRFAVIILFVCLFSSVPVSGDDVGIVRKAVERGTLNQPGTKPFHLVAVLAPSRDRDKDLGLTGQVEIWWASPVEYRREVRSPNFHQVLIVNNGQEWQKNDGDYFPEWLREIAEALINPIPNLDDIQDDIQSADVKKVMGSTYFSWTIPSTDGKVQTTIGAGIAIKDASGLLFYGDGEGWGAEFADYQGFHNRMVARTVKAGSPEATATVITLEDLPAAAPAFFNAQASGGDSSPIHTVVVRETALRQNEIQSTPPVWPPVKDGPLEVGGTAEIVVDRSGTVREVGTIVTNNPALRDDMSKAIGAMRFRPYLKDGAPVQVVSRISIGFTTTRPAGMETFDSARNYFERGRQKGFPAAGKGPSYVLKASFEARTSAGDVETGRYVDTWKGADHWRREASVGKSRFIRAQRDDKRYRLAEGPDATLLELVLTVLEPIPAIDTFVESDWRITRDKVGNTNTIRVLTGYELPDRTLDPEQSRGYWFDDNGVLLKTYSRGIETRRSDFSTFENCEIPHTILVLHDGSLGMKIHVTEVSEAGTLPDDMFVLHGHDWQRAFTAEVR